MDNKCVYLHKTNDDIVFYVGSGTIDRAFDLEKTERTGKATMRGKLYSDFVKSINFEYKVEIVKGNLTKENAIEIEQELYLKYIDTIVNKNLPSKYKSMDVDFNSYLSLDNNSPSGLVWKDSVLNGGQTNRVPNSIAGTLMNNGYWRVRLNGNLFLAHRVVFAIVNGDIGQWQIDHIDGNKQNNRIDNLRKVSQAENNSFISRQKYISTVLCCSKNWRAIIKTPDGEICKRFSISKYGFIVANYLAEKFRNETMERYYGAN